MTRDEILVAARAYVGVRFKLRGRSRMGIDCIGLLIAVGRDLGQEIEDVEHYRIGLEDSRVLRQMIEAQSDEGAINCIKTGSIVMLKQSGMPMHCGIAVLDGGEAMLIHSNIRAKAVVEQPMRAFWSDIVSVREFKGVS